MNNIVKVYKEVGTGGERERALSTPCVSHTTHNCALPQNTLSDLVQLSARPGYGVSRSLL